LEKARPILDKYNKILFERRELDGMVLENELKPLLGLGVCLLEINRESPGVCCESQEPLANVYGISDYFADDREAKRTAFWDQFFASHLESAHGHTYT
jgi:hypothetical protein